MLGGATSVVLYSTYLEVGVVNGVWVIVLIICSIGLSIAFLKKASLSSFIIIIPIMGALCRILGRICL